MKVCAFESRVNAGSARENILQLPTYNSFSNELNRLKIASEEAQRAPRSAGTAQKNSFI